MRRLLACLLASTVSVAEAQTEGIYVGLGIGEFDYEEQFVDDVLGQRVGDTVTSYKLYGGFEINQYLAIEVGYTRDDSSQHSISTSFPGFGNVFYLVDIDFTKTAVSAIGQLPLEPMVLFAGLGYFSADQDFAEFADLECCGQVVNSGTVSLDGMMAKLGAEWRFGRFGTRYGLRLEYEWWDMDDIDASTVGLGFSYGF